MSLRFRQHRTISSRMRRKRGALSPAGFPERSAGTDAGALPAYIRECEHGWHVCNGRDETCGFFSRQYDRCRLRGRTVVLCRCRPVSIEVFEFRWDDAIDAFVEFRRYFDDSPARGDGF